MTLAGQINSFNNALEFNHDLPEGIEVMNPFRDHYAAALSESFYDKFFCDSKGRVLILGINHGRLGGGVTGIPFTDPVKLQDICGIENTFKKVTEPSAGFVYDMIQAFGGVERFYSEFLIQAVSPLGFIRHGINYNYYDSPKLTRLALPFIIDSLKKLCSFHIKTDICYCMGIGANFRFLDNLNRKEGFFGKIIPLPHPRWIVQYRRKRYAEFIQFYISQLNIYSQTGT